MNAVRFAALALLLAGAAHARPVVIEEAAIITPPDETWEIFGGFGVAIDGDHALVSGERFVEDSTAEGGIRHEGIVFHFRRSGSTWVFAGEMGHATLDDATLPGLAMKDGVAMTITDTARIWEVTPDGSWSLAPIVSTVANAVQGRDIDIDAGRILVPRKRCKYESVVLRKISAAWRIEGDIGGVDCRTATPPHTQDLQGDRVLVHNPDGIGREPHRAIWYRPGAGGGWEDFRRANISGGPHVALNGTLNAIGGLRATGTEVGYDLDSGESGARSFYSLQPVDGLLQPGNRSATALERAGTLFAQRNFSFNRDAHVINLFRVHDDAVHSNSHVATLQARSGESLGSLLDADGLRIIVSGHGDTGGSNMVRVFDLPASFDTPAAETHDFESPSPDAAWQPTAGSTFEVASVNGNHVYRQLSVQGNPASHLPGSAGHDQAIQVEVTMLGYNGQFPWVGLNSRRTDDANYYYVTLRLSGAIELKRMAGGVFTTLASAPANVSLNRMYRLRLESIGAQHRVYLDDRLVLAASDTTHAQGTVGVMMNRAAASYDNVVVTPSPLATIYVENFTSFRAEDWIDFLGAWQASSGVYRPTGAPTLGFSRAVIPVRSEDQVVQARIRPTGFAEPDNWVGLMARYQDDRNYLYVSLRGRDVISLWRRIDGVITQLATARMPVDTGNWYHVRLEVIGGLTRVFVNGQLRLFSSADPGPDNPNVDWTRGFVGLITYKAAADFDDFLAYQP